MELAELLEREGLDPDELMTWAASRAAALVAELEASPDEPLLQLLRGDVGLELAPPPSMALVGDDEDLPIAVGEVEDDELAAAQPISAAELPPPPEPPPLAEGEPEPLLETFDTGPIDVDGPEAAALLARSPELASDQAPEEEDEEEFEELEIDELVELADDELEVLDEPEAPLPPPHPPRPEQAPIRTGDTATHMVVSALADDEPEDVDLDPPPSDEDEDEDGFDLDLDGL